MDSSSTRLVQPTQCTNYSAAPQRLEQIVDNNGTKKLVCCMLAVAAVFLVASAPYVGHSSFMSVGVTTTAANPKVFMNSASRSQPPLAAAVPRGVVRAQAEARGSAQTGPAMSAQYSGSATPAVSGVQIQAEELQYEYEPVQYHQSSSKGLAGLLFAAAAASFAGFVYFMSQKKNEFKNFIEESSRSAVEYSPYPVGHGRIAMAAIEATSITRSDVPLELEEGEMPMNTFGPKAPFKAKIKSVKVLTGPKATGETCDVVIETNGDIPFWEGQSYGVVPPGTKVNSRGKEVPHGTRLYSIASSRYGDEFDGKTTTLCIRRATYWCPEMNAEDPAKKGICSNFLCDAKPGDEIMMTGPTGKVLLLDPNPNVTHICVATGTGIAPFRSFWRRMFYENTPDYQFKGKFWLFMGAANSDAKLYDDELQAIAKTNPDQFQLDYALSREQTNKDGGKMYIQDKVEEYADEVFTALDNGAHIYFCGLKGMMPGIQDMLERVAKSKGLDWEEYFGKLKHGGQWHVEVY